MEILEIPELYNLIHGYIYTYPEASELFSKNKLKNTDLIRYLKSIAVIEQSGHVDGVLHSLDGQPIVDDNNRRWYMNGKLHQTCRDENGLVLPAVIYFSGEMSWYKYGHIHRICKDKYGKVLPAIIWEDRQVWCRNGKWHRTCTDENGKVLPAVIRGDEFYWYRNGKLHRECTDENGKVLPAVIRGDEFFWYRNGKLHRECKDETGLILPALIYPSVKSWYLNGVHIFTSRDLDRMGWWYIYFRQKLYFLSNYITYFQVV